jgi:hypothetical protein
MSYFGGSPFIKGADGEVDGEYAGGCEQGCVSGGGILDDFYTTDGHFVGFGNLNVVGVLAAATILCVMVVIVLIFTGSSALGGFSIFSTIVLGMYIVSDFAGKFGGYYGSKLKNPVKNMFN